MTEQENHAETQYQFPKIPKAIVDNFIETVWQKPKPEKKLEMAAKIKANEPFLDEIVEELAEEYGDAEGVKAGAYVAYELLASLEQELPQVSKEVAEVLKQEYSNFSIPEQPLEPFIQPSPIGQELINPMLDPYHYAEENPSLMVWIAELPEDSIQVGFMLVYELKRRQFLSDQLAEQLGDK